MELTGKPSVDKPWLKYYDKNAFVITGKTDKYTEPTIYEGLYKRNIKKIKVRYKKFHSLRHTFATKCIELGMPTKELSLILGHADVGTTLNIYIHPDIESSVKFLNQL